MLPIAHTSYTRTEYVDGLDVLEHASTADAAHVERFLAARDWFESIAGSPETHTLETDGTIVVTRKDPEGTTHITTFTPA